MKSGKISEIESRGPWAVASQAEGATKGMRLSISRIFWTQSLGELE